MKEGSSKKKKESKVTVGAFMVYESIKMKTN